MKIRFLAIALVALPAAPAAVANSEIRQQTVHYKDLDLATEAGRKELGRRIGAAAREVCGMDERHLGSRIAPPGSRECYRKARSQIDERIAALAGRQARGA